MILRYELWKYKLKKCKFYSLWENNHSFERGSAKTFSASSFLKRILSFQKCFSKQRVIVQWGKKDVIAY